MRGFVSSFLESVAAVPWRSKEINVALEGIYSTTGRTTIETIAFHCPCEMSLNGNYTAESEGEL